MSRKPQRVDLITTDADAAGNTETILDLVMTYLPTRDCVRTSILSSRWRYRWTTIPILVFDKNYCPSSFKSHTVDGHKALADFINCFLILHTGPIQVFQVKDVCVVPCIDHWILRVSKGSIHTLGLELCDGLRPRYKLHSSVYTCESLKNLKLGYCELRPPPCFKGFKNLKCLDLEDVALTDDVFENLVSSCPLLEELRVVDSRGLDHLRIDARDLKFLYIKGIFWNISFGHTHNKLLSISVTQDNEGPDREISLTEFLTNVPNIQRFELFRFLFALECDSILEGSSIQCKDLYCIVMRIDLCYMEECLTAISLFKSSPNLTELKLECLASSSVDRGVWTDRSKCCWELKRLQLVTLDEFSSTRAELEFVKYVLGNSPVLEKMTIIPLFGNMACKVIKRICGFELASDKAEIFFGNNAALEKAGRGHQR